MMIKDKSIKKILWWIFAVVLISMIAVSVNAQHNKTFISVTLDSLTQRQDTLWITDDAGSVCYIRTSGDSLFLGDGTGEKAIVNLSTGGTPGGSPTYSQYNDAGSFGGDADVKHYTDSLVVSKLLKVDEISVGGGATVDTIYDYADIALDTSGVPLDNQLMYYVEPHKVAGSEYLTIDNVYIDNTNNGFGNDVFTNLTTGTYNTVLGRRAGYDLTEGIENTLLGVYAGTNLTTGDENVIIGLQAGNAATIENSNVFVGYQSGYSTTGSQNLFLGYKAGENTLSVSNRLIIGSIDRASTSADTTLSIIHGVQAATTADQRLDLNANVVVKENLTVDGVIFNEKYEAAAYLHPDSTITTSISTSWIFLGDGSNNKFTNFDTEGFSFDGDTIQFDQDATDSRDSIEFRIAYSCESATSNVNKTVFCGIFIKEDGGSVYVEKPQCTKRSRTASAAVFYPGPVLSLMPVWLKDGDKLHIRVKCATSTTTLSTESFGIYLFEE